VKPEGKRPLRTHGHRWEDNIKMEFKEIDWEGRDWMRIGTSGRLLQKLQQQKVYRPAFRAHHSVTPVTQKPSVPWAY
jgi:hypothetical protein